MKNLTINNIDLSRKNNMNIVTVESEYDAAMSHEAKLEKENPTHYLACEVNSYFWRKGYADRKEIQHTMDYAKRTLTAEQFEAMKAEIKPEALTWAGI